MSEVTRIFFNSNRYEQSTPTGDPAIDNGTYGGYVAKIASRFQIDGDSVDVLTEPDKNSAKSYSLSYGNSCQASYVYLGADGQVWYCFGAHQWLQAYYVK